jgi:hypothetical protein
MNQILFYALVSLVGSLVIVAILAWALTSTGRYELSGRFPNLMLSQPGDEFANQPEEGEAYARSVSPHHMFRPDGETSHARWRTPALGFHFMFRTLQDEITLSTATREARARKLLRR